MTNYDALKSHKSHLIRKTLGGSAFFGPMTAAAVPPEPFVYTPAAVGPPATLESIEFVTGIFDDYRDVGLLSDDGIAFENEVSESNVTSWQSTSPTRTDITSDIDSMTLTPQQTGRLQINLWTGADLQEGSRNASTGTVSFAKSERPSTREWRMCAIGVDGEGDEQFIVGRYYPRVKVTGRSGQSFSKGDDPLTWGLTLQARYDAAAGFSCRYFFGGLGWRKALADMGFTALT